MSLREILKSFHDDEDGVISIELCFCVPILVWALLSTHVYFEVFRAQSISTRASITIADMISREELAITEEYLENARVLLGILTEVDDDPDMRVSVYWYDEGNDRLEVSWSFNRGYGQELTSDVLNDYDELIPMMANLDRAILVETRTEYDTPEYSFWPTLAGGSSGGAEQGLGVVDFQSFTVIKPRFLTQFCYDDQPTVDGNEMDC